MLADFFETGHQYLLHLARCRDEVWVNGTRDQVEALDAQIREVHVHQQLPWRKKLDVLFSQVGYERFGDGILPFWAGTLLELVTLEHHWEAIVLGNKPTCPYLRLGWHADKDVYSTDWLEDFRPGWSEGLLAALPGPQSHQPLPHAASRKYRTSSSRTGPSHHGCRIHTRRGGGTCLP